MSSADGTVQASGRGERGRGDVHPTTIMGSNFHPSFSPSPETFNHWLQTLTGFCKLIANPHGRPRNDCAADEPLRLKLTQALGEQTVGEPRHRRHQFVKALRPTQHHADDRAAPTSPDQFHRVVKTRTDFRFSFASVPFRGRCRPFSRALNSTCLFLHG